MQTLNITVKSMAAPKAANPEKGWAGTKNYQVFSEDGTKYLASPNIGIGSVQENDKISITVGNPDRFGNLYIKSFEPVTAPTGHNEVPEEVKKAFPNAKVLPGNGYSQLQTAAKDLQSLLPNNQYMIVLQTILKTGTKPEDWDIALRWYFDNLKAGVLETDKRLNGGEEVL